MSFHGIFNKITLKKKAEPNNVMADECVLLMEINAFIINFANPFGDFGM